MFRLEREERGAWVTWPARAAALMASELAAALGDEGTVEAALTQKVLEAHVRAQLDSLAEIRTGLGEGSSDVAAICSCRVTFDPTMLSVWQLFAPK